MIERDKIISTQIDPNDFKDTTVYVEPEDDPEAGFVAIVVEPIIVTEDGRVLTVLERFAPIDRFAVDFTTFINGGSDNGLRLPGMLREIELRNSPQMEERGNIRESIHERRGCWWCGVDCNGSCGAPSRPVNIDWEKVQQVFPSGIPLRE